MNLSIHSPLDPNLGRTRDNDTIVASILALEYPELWNTSLMRLGQFAKHFDNPDTLKTWDGDFYSAVYADSHREVVSFEINFPGTENKDFPDPPAETQHCNRELIGSFPNVPYLLKYVACPRKIDTPSRIFISNCKEAEEILDDGLNIIAPLECLENEMLALRRLFGSEYRGQIILKNSLVIDKISIELERLFPNAKLVKNLWLV